MKCLEKITEKNYRIMLLIYRLTERGNALIGKVFINMFYPY